jgi:hypothetical protein
MDVGGMPHASYLKAIELLGTEVLPQVREALSSQPVPAVPQPASTCEAGTTG